MEHEELLPKELTLTKDDQLQFTPQFEDSCKQISDAVDKIDHLVTLQNIDETDETQLEQAIQDAAQAQKIKRSADVTRKQLKRYLDSRVDAILTVFDDKLRSYKFDRLQQSDAQIKQWKKDLSASRINHHWDEIQGTFEANLANYPLIKQLAPQLTDFNLFKLRHPKLVNGSKSWRFGDKQMAELNQDLFDMNECLTDLNNNAMNLTDSYRISVLNDFIANPTKMTYLSLKNRALELMRADAERAKAAAEMAKQAQTQQNTATQPAQPVTQPTQQPQQPVHDLIAESNKWLAKYTTAHRLAYSNLATDNSQKTKLIFDLVHQLDNPQSEFSTFLKTVDDADKLELTVLRQILLV